ncbi:hypothetical protein KSX_41420 [Ktedonospora formicarum]|uniref:Uncharacterized protein n=1 Tax=Ktedonospora formicarum TaxID=2778364 RepID=A0A8J3I5X4_9CHLR|nr:hypothetical protein KSX_41420 [Ktedonospora formicarum]
MVHVPMIGVARHHVEREESTMVGTERTMLFVKHQGQSMLLVTAK